MERRTLTAVALSFLVIVLWTNLFGPPQGDPEQPADTTTTTTETPLSQSAPLGQSESLFGRSEEPISPGTSDPVSTGSGGESVFARDDDPAPRDVLVETPLFIATFTTQGGALASFNMQGYLLANGDPIDLIGPGPAQPVLEIDPDGTGPAAPTDFSSHVFAVDRRPANGLSTGELVFTLEGTDGARVERFYRFQPDTYEIEMSTRVSGMPARDRARLTTAWTAGLPITERDAGLDRGEFATMVRVGDSVEKEGLGKFKNGGQPAPFEGNVQWAATRSKYFLSATYLDGTEAQRAEMFGDQETDHLGYAVSSEFFGGATTADYRFYLGPIKQKFVVELGGGLEKKVGIATMPMGSVFGWFAKLLYTVMNRLYSVIPNYGVVILIIATTTKLIFYPLTRKSAQSMRGMSELKPHMDAIREKYKDDAQKMNSEVLGLYKKHGVNPLAGCLPLLIQMPVFWALYGVLRSAIELRQAPFVLWINDLSAPDILFDFGTIPFLPDQIHLLPLLMAGTTVLMQQKVMTDPRQKALVYMMPVMMLFFFYNLPAGLNLYWTAQNLLAWAEQSIVRSKAVPEAAKAA